jgi:hypothetical protein
VSISGLLQLASTMGLNAAQASASGPSTAVATVDSMNLKDVIAQWLAGAHVDISTTGYLGCLE